ncbi:CO dehydrogenase/acetyl-CoA synthase subunit delta [Acidobacteriota bacterium]
MSFEIPKDNNTGQVVTVRLGATPEQGGTRSPTLTVGGSTALPFHFFEGRFPNPPVVAMEVFDRVPPKFPSPLMDYFGNVLDQPGEMAKKCIDNFGADLISVRLSGTHPEKGDLSAEEASEVVQDVLKSVSVPLIISGHSHFEKNNSVMKKVCEITAGENCLINFVETDNYKTIAAACIAYNHTLVGQSPIDVNMAKQLNILLTDMDFPLERIVMDPLTGTLGYGLEYTYSIMERIRIDGLSGDKMLSSPMLVNPGYETSLVKEARTHIEDNPDWGELSERLAHWEIATAMSLLITGAEILILYHPEAVTAVKEKIKDMFQTQKDK